MFVGAFQKKLCMAAFPAATPSPRDHEIESGCCWKRSRHKITQVKQTCEQKLNDLCTKDNTK